MRGGRCHYLAANPFPHIKKCHGGVDIDDVVEAGKTSSLMVAAREGYQELVKLLLDR